MPRHLLKSSASSIAYCGLLVSSALGQNWDGSLKRADNTVVEPNPTAYSGSTGDPWPLTPNERMARSVRQVPWRSASDEVRSAPGIVSVKQIEHPLTDKSKRRLENAAKDIREGRQDEGIKKLLGALEDPSMAGYANGLLGTEYLRQGHLQLAVDHLTAAVDLLPGSAAMHSNLGYAFCLTGAFQRGETEVRKAVALDPDAAPIQYLLGLILLNRSAPHREVMEHLVLAQKSIRNAHLALAILYAIANQRSLMDEQLRLFNPDDGAIEPLTQWVSNVASLPQAAASLWLWGSPTGATGGRAQ